MLIKYDGKRILSPAAVRLMVRTHQNHIIMGERLFNFLLC